MNDQSPPAPARFRNPDRSPGALPAFAVARLVAGVGDVALILDADGTVRDVAVSSPGLAANGFGDWAGRALIDTVTIESRPKVIEMMGDAESAPRWRQINHVAPAGEIAMRYFAVGAGADGRVIAIGRDMRAQAAMQQRLLQTQQSLERDYLSLRQAESRYRMLFDIAGDAILVVDATNRRIREANPAAHRLLGLRDGALTNQPVSAIADSADRESLIAYFGAATATDDVPSVTVRGPGGAAELRVTATPFRQDRAQLMLVRLMPGDSDAGPRDTEAAARDIVEHMPDAFVLADLSLNILAANAAFVDLAQVASAERLRGRPLGDWLGRPGIDLDLFATQLREHGSIRNLPTILRGSAGSQDEVEVSAVLAPGNGSGEICGFTIRAVSRRLADVAATDLDLPRSVEQLTELVGRMSLKDIVRESTDLIERLCIEAALVHTSDNRASAAEILGVSRQSLYAKLHRHGLGNLAQNGV